MKPKLLLAVVFALASNYSFTQTQVTFYTNKGTFVVNMEETKRPLTTANFLKLVKAKFYDKTLFYRVINGFVIQGGDGNGSNIPAIKDELTPAFSNLQKTIAMANAGPNTGSSEIYINLVSNTNLDKNYTAFGTVISNFTVVQAIGAVPTTGSSGNPADKPLTDVFMDSVRVTVPTGINEMNEQLPVVAIFPNPTTGLIYISNAENTTGIFVTDILGKEVLLPANRNKNIIDFNSAPAGIYFLNIKTSHGIEVEKILRE